MSEKSLDTALLAIEVLCNIPKSRKIDSHELQQKLADAGYVRDKRSIQRLLKVLAENFDIEVDDRSKPYGYRWKQNSNGLNIPSLSPQQALVLRLAEEQLKTLLPANIMRSMQGFFEQARSQLSGDNKKLEKQWLNKVAIAPTSQPLLPAKVSGKIFDTISTALFENRYLMVNYQGQYRSHQARIMPLALVQQGASSYLVARYQDDDTPKHLALHRIKSAELSTMFFDRPIDFVLKNYVNDAHFGFGNGKLIQLRFSVARYAGFHLTETPLSADQQILEQSDQYYRFQATVVDSEMLDWWLAKFGEDIWDIEKIEI
ncbi:helix-turn-helix transcriptional regulator [Lonepinella sp. BR2357]|uniref:helix-turn-helix transcriptional regulator n=1 Tax=Lonepinella sp. BR2357 TaxID=3434549 RepID=UPI003F6DF871